MADKNIELYFITDFTFLFLFVDMYRIVMEPCPIVEKKNNDGTKQKSLYCIFYW